MKENLPQIRVVILSFSFRFLGLGESPFSLPCRRRHTRAEYAGRERGDAR
jgi:hypothetical protein